MRNAHANIHAVKQALIQRMRLAVQYIKNGIKYKNVSF